MPASLFCHADTNFTVVLPFNDYKAHIQPFLNDFCAFKTRIAGSENEKNAAIFIKNYIETNISGVSAVTDTSTVSGIQTFKFVSNNTGLYETSQNVIFRYTPAQSTNKKVIICTNYDAPQKYDAETGKFVSFDNDALNTSAASVAALVMLAKTLPELHLNFNIEFVFFGAGEMNQEGSKFYTNGLSSDETENILCVINLDKIALGEKTYFYIDEVSTKFSDYVAGVTTGFAKEIDLVHLAKIETGGELGLTYSHVANSSDNVKFMKRGITTINFFAGSYETGVSMGLCEYVGKPVLSYTDKDTIEYILATYGENAIYENLYNVSCCVESLLNDSNFVSQTMAARGQTKWFYNVFANRQLVVFVTAVAFIVTIIVAMFIYYKLTVKSYYANIEIEFLSSVMKISEQIGDGSDEKEVAKVVSQVIAGDIKKNKTLSPEKNKNKKKK